MAKGDQPDFLARLKAVLPGGWFPDVTPVLDGTLAGCANAWAWCHGLLALARAQSRRLTASGVFLDMIAADFFARSVRRRVNESDALLSARIGRELFREKGTRAGLARALTDLTGRAPAIFEPAFTGDTGGYGVAGGGGYGVAGGYGSLALPFQFFVTAYRPTGQGVAGVAGYGNRQGITAMPGGYGVGAMEYATPAMFAPQVADADILAVINDVRPVASIAWTRLSGGSASNVVVLGTPVTTPVVVTVGGGGAATPPVTPPVVTPPAVTPPAANLLPGGSSNPPAPSTISGGFTVSGWTYQTYNGIAYIRMLPANYDPTKRYALLVWLHTDDDGSAYYNGGISADQSYGVAAKFQQYFQSTAFQRNFPCVFIAPLLDQRAQTSDGQINFGGYGNSLAGHQAITALVKYEMTQHPIDAARIYSAGASMGGTGTVVNLVLDNTINGSEQPNVYAAGLALSPVDYDAASLVSGSYVVSSAVVSQIQAGVPLGLIHGASDTEQPAARFSLPLYNQLGGTGGNANGMAWSRAGSSNT